MSSTTAGSASSTSTPPVVPDTSTVIERRSLKGRITSVTVFTTGNAEVTRVVNMTAESKTGLYEVEVTGFPSACKMDKDSIRVKGTGYCTILHVTYDGHVQAADSENEKQDNEKEGESRRAREERIQKETRDLMDEHQVLSQEFARNQRMRQMADRFVEDFFRTSSRPLPPFGNPPSVPDSPTPAVKVEEADNTLHWWSMKARETDAEEHRLQLEGRRVMAAVAKLHEKPSQPRRYPSKIDMTKVSGKVTISIDVTELGPIQLEVKSLVSGATWTPAYDLRVDTQTDSISCTYYANVHQNTTEDWEGVSLSLSTAQPTTRATPPQLGPKTVSLRAKEALSRPSGGFHFAPKSDYHPPRGGGLFGAAAGEGNASGAFSFGGAPPPGAFGAFGAAPQGFGATSQGFGATSAVDGASAPPPLPQATPAVAQVDGRQNDEDGSGDGARGNSGMGPVCFVITRPVTIKNEAQNTRLTVGILQLNAEVTHYVIPSREGSAFLQAKATNNTDYLLLSSKDVSIYFDNSFVNKTSLACVSPGESFQTFLGVDPAVKIKCAPTRQTGKQKWMFGKSHQVTHVHSTSISNKKQVPITCVVLAAVPRSTNDLIKVTLKQPSGNIPPTPAVSNEDLVIAALGMFGPNAEADEGRKISSKNNTTGTNGNGVSSTAPSTPTSSAPAAVSAIAGITKSPLEHLAWVANVAPQDELQIPLEYNVEWPADRNIDISGE